MKAEKTYQADETTYEKRAFIRLKGLSTGLIYPPGIFADIEEIIELAKTLTHV